MIERTMIAFVDQKKITILRLLFSLSLAVCCLTASAGGKRVNRVLTVCQFLAWFKTVDLFATGKSEKLSLKPSVIGLYGLVAVSINVHNIIGAASCSFRFNADPINRAYFIDRLSIANSCRVQTTWRNSFYRAHTSHIVIPEYC